MTDVEQLRASLPEIVELLSFLAELPPQARANIRRVVESHTSQRVTVHHAFALADKSLPHFVREFVDAIPTAEDDDVELGFPRDPD